MATTFTADQAAASFPVYEGRGGGAVNFAFGVYELTANPTNGDVYKMCKLPAGARVIDGFVRSDGIDSGTETLDMDVGTSADTDAYGNLGVWNVDAVTNVRSEAGQIYYPFNGTLKDGPAAAFTTETTIQLYCNTTASAGYAAGTIYVGVYYITP